VAETSAPNTNIVLAVPVFFVASLFAIGVTALAYIAFQSGFRHIVADSGTAAKVAYVTLALGSLLSLLACILGYLYMIAIVMINGYYQP